MERKPHKSSWSDRKRKGEPTSEKRKVETVMNLEVREKLNKIKKYLMVCAIAAIIPIILFLLMGWGILTFLPFINLIIVFIVVFFIYFPISDLLRTPEKKDL